MPGVQLDHRGQQLHDEIAAHLKKARAWLHEQHSSDVIKALYDELAEKAHALHVIVQPKHHKYMIENRHVSPDTVEFYRHIHSVEDLLAYVADITANDDPDDVTIGAKFTFNVFTRRWGRNDQYRITRMADGWRVEHVMIGGDCDEEGKPYLFKNLEHDSVCYPAQLGDHMRNLWKAAAEKGLSHAQVQAKLQEIADWVSLCEQRRPQTFE